MIDEFRESKEIRIALNNVLGAALLNRRVKTEAFCLQENCNLLSTSKGNGTAKTSLWQIG